MSLSSRRVVIVSSALAQPRHHKRAAMFQKAGFDVSVYGYSRGYYTVNRFPEGIAVHSLGRLALGQYVKRIPHLLKGVARIRNAERSRQLKPKVVYAFGPDAAIVALGAFGSDVSLFYEIGDLRNVKSARRLSTKMFRELERFIVSRADGLVLTSEGFVDAYYNDLGSSIKRKTLVIENRLPDGFATELGPRQALRTWRRPLRIGFVGYLRYADTVLPMIDAVAARPDEFEFHLYGDGPLRPIIEDRSSVSSNVYYHGSFKYPDDLSSIYSGLDLNYVVYNNRDLNVRVAIPNKYFESLYFGIPIVAAANTSLAERVRTNGCGFVVDPSGSDFAEHFLDTLTQGALEDASRRALAQPTSSLVNDDIETYRRMATLSGLPVG